MTKEEKALIYFKKLREQKVKDYSVVFDTAPKDSVVYAAVSAEIEIYDIVIKAIEQLLSYNSIKTELETCGDCVNRQAALRQAINAHKMAQENGFDFKDICEEYLNVLPPVTPQPEVIRCKDCKHWTNNIGNSALRDNYCNEEAHGFYYRCSGGDYCSFAERRTDG